MALLRVCPECRCHKKPRIMGWTKSDYQGITHGICDECMVEVRKELNALREARAWQTRKDAGAPNPRVNP